MKILVTGGAGFIGSHLADALIGAGHQVRVLDNLALQVHGPEYIPVHRGACLPSILPGPPPHLNPAVEFVYGDVREPMMYRQSADGPSVLEGVDAVFHFAAAVGVGQSMYRMADYVSVNSHGTAVLLEALIERPVKKLIVASSMSVYGEGPVGLLFGKPEPAHEDVPADLRSIYALTKYDQEKLCLIVGEAYGIPTTALRFFNVYGPRQALSNPYTGVIAIFASRLLNDRPPLIYEDGLQSRDFVSVYDVVHGCMRALESDATGVFNIGTGTAMTVRDVALFLGHVLGKYIEPVFTGTKRAGDIRHCFANIDRARQMLGYSPCVKLDEGLADLGEWLRGQTAVDGVEGAAQELVERGLVA